MYPFVRASCLILFPKLAEKKVISVEMIDSDKKKKRKKKKSKKSSTSNRLRSSEIESSKEEIDKSQISSKKLPESASTKMESSKPRRLSKKSKKLSASKNKAHGGTKEFEEFVKKLEHEEGNADDQLFFFQPELENDEANARPEPPFLPKKRSKHDFTLVLDLDETLVHFEETEDNQQFLVRPYAQQFLAEMGKYYEVVIFTAAVQEVPYPT